MKISLKIMVKIFCNPYLGEIYHISNFVKLRVLEISAFKEKVDQTAVYKC